MKQFVDDISQIPTESKSAQYTQFFRKNLKRFLAGSIVLVAVGGTMKLTLSMLIPEPPPPVAELTDSAPVVTPEQNVQTAGNGINNNIIENVVHVEYLDKLDTQLNSQTTGDISWNNFTLSIPQGYTLTSDNFYTSGEQCILFTTVSDFTTQLNWVQTKMSAPLLDNNTATVLDVPFVTDTTVANLSNGLQGIVVWDKQIQLAYTTVYQTIIMCNSGYISLMSPYQYLHDVRDSLLQQIRLGRPINTYKINGTRIDRLQSVEGYTILTPSDSHLMEEGVGYNYIDLGKTFSDNLLYIIKGSTSDLPSIQSQLELALAADNPGVIDGISLKTEVYASWLNRPGKYLEYSAKGKRICCYLFENQLDNTYAAFAVYERDNKFPQLLRYLNTLALELF